MSSTSNYPPTSRVGYVLKRYPRYSETFIVNEILAHEVVGQEIEIFALRPVEETHFQDQLGRVRAPVTRLRDKFSGPEPFWQRLAAACEERPAALNVLSEIDGIVSGQDVAQALDLAVEVQRRGVTHLHAHFGTVANFGCAAGRCDGRDRVFVHCPCKGHIPRIQRPSASRPQVQGCGHGGYRVRL